LSLQLFDGRVWKHTLLNYNPLLQLNPDFLPSFAHVEGQSFQVEHQLDQLIPSLRAARLDLLWLVLKALSVGHTCLNLHPQVFHVGYRQVLGVLK
jgi:hypothetical protein